LLERGKDDRRRVDEIEAESAQISNELERTSIKATKINNSLINIKAGIQHLKDLTKFYKNSGENYSHDGIEDDLK
jgi:hypothetical protein